MSTKNSEFLTIKSADFREALREAYRSGYAIGYAGGRVDEMTEKPWNAAVPWEKTEKDA